MLRIRFFIIVCLLFGGWIMAQDTRNVSDPSPVKPQYQAYKKEKKGLFSFLKKKKNPTLKTNEEERADFRKRVKLAYAENAKGAEKVKKQKVKEAKKGTRYFGHKRPPKKRAANKQKFCKVCGIKH